MNSAMVPRSLDAQLQTGIVYSFCSLVTDLEEYGAMVRAFEAKGFTAIDCEFIYADNASGNRFDAYAAYNRFLIEAQGKYVVLCHQDITPLVHDRSRLDTLLDDLTTRDPHWALAGNGGSTKDGEHVYRIMHGEDIVLVEGGPVPKQVMSLDENFMVVRRDANLALSRDLTGFHWYGADLGIIANILGWNAYVVDFHLYHRSPGTIGDDYIAQGKALRAKYSRAFRSRWQHVPTQRPVYLSGSPLRTLVFRSMRRIGRQIEALLRS